MKSTDDEKLLNLKEACEVLNISPTSMYRLLKQGAVPAHKIGGQWRFFKDELLKWARSQ